MVFIYIALYARQSIEKENSVSIETQLEYSKNMIRPEEQHYPVKAFADKGYSGKDTNRPDFQALLKEVQKGRVKKLIVYKLDRVSRSLIDFVDMIQLFKTHNVAFVSAQELFDTASPYGEMLMKLLMVFAEFERTSIVNRIRDAYEKRSSMGLYAGGRRAYGYDLAETVIQGIRTKKYVPRSGEAEHIKYIFETYAMPEVTLRRLQDNLLANGIRSLSGTDWTTGKLGAILRNPIYVKADADIYDYYQGHQVQIVNDVHAFDGTHNVQLYGRTKHDKSLPDWSDMKIVLLESEGLVDSATWLKCQQKLEKNKRVGKSWGNHTTWLSGKLVCAKCGHTMTTIKGETKRYFLCTGKTHKKTCSGIKGPVYVEDIEAMVYDCIAEKLNALKRLRPKQSSVSAERVNELKIKRKQIEQQQEQLSAAVLDGTLNPELIQVLNKKAKLLSEQQRSVTEKLGALAVAEQDVQYSINFVRRWSRASFEEKRAIANVLIQTIVLHEDGTHEIIWNI